MIKLFVLTKGAMMKRSLILGLLILLGAMGIASAQTGTVNVTVTSNGTTPITDATVTLYKSSSQVGQLTTGASGIYTFSSLTAGTDYTILVVKDGYVTQSSIAVGEVSDGAETAVSVTMGSTVNITVTSNGT
ncbi:MAG TPA: hypothetical protein DCO75_08135, partial [Fibrobacteres bacterium]|nr:hypothetical protein [Fibrobacterota bacterium]